MARAADEGEAALSRQEPRERQQTQPLQAREETPEKSAARAFAQQVFAELDLVLKNLCESKRSNDPIERGSEANLISSSSTGTISAHQVPMSAAGSKRSSFSLEQSGIYISCGDNHGIEPQNREQYLSHLQQKEVTQRASKMDLSNSVVPDLPLCAFN
ncbi:syntabulin-like [Tyto alba]|uniref:syntabulin-like n=1 Tax=Tyto alba TaxID=56313 RepID=UPI001C66A73F|nr:syntabulin-like [Tyto alba]